MPIELEGHTTMHQFNRGNVRQYCRRTLGLLFLAWAAPVVSQPSTANLSSSARWNVDIAAGGAPLPYSLLAPALKTEGRLTRALSVAARWNADLGFGAGLQAMWITSDERVRSGNVEVVDHSKMIALAAIADYELRLMRKVSLAPSLGMGVVPWGTSSHLETRQSELIRAPYQFSTTGVPYYTAALTLQISRFSITSHWILSENHFNPFTIGWRF